MNCTTLIKKKKIKKAGIGVSCLVLAVSLAVPGEATTLADALIQAYQTNPRIRIGQSVLDAANAAVSETTASALPQVSATANASLARDFDTDDSTERDLSLRLAMNQIIFDGGQSRYALQAMQQTALSSEQRLLAAEQAVLLDAVTAFVNVRRDQQLVTLAASNVDVLTEELRASNDRFEIGLLSRTDVSQTQARLSAARAELEIRRGALLRSREIYRSVIGSEPQDLVSPPPPPELPPDVAAAEAVAMERHPRVLEALLNMEAASATANQMRGNWIPTLSADISHTLRRQSTRDSTSSRLSAGLTGRATLFDSGKSRSQRQRANAVLAQRRHELQLAGAVTRQSIRIAYSNWIVANASVDAIEQQVESAQLALEGVREEQSLGARSTLDVLNAEQEVRNARANLLTATRDVFVAAYTVLFEMGLLTMTHLNLGTDPAQAEPASDPG